MKLLWQEEWIHGVVNVKTYKYDQIQMISSQILLDSASSERENFKTSYQKLYYRGILLLRSFIFHLH